MTELCFVKAEIFDVHVWVVVTQVVTHCLPQTSQNQDKIIFCFRYIEHCRFSWMNFQSAYYGHLEYWIWEIFIFSYLGCQMWKTYTYILGSNKTRVLNPFEQSGHTMDSDFTMCRYFQLPSGHAQIDWRIFHNN